MPEVTVEAEMGEGPPPDGVLLTVSQGSHELRRAEVDAEKPSTTFEMDPGDYVAHATSLVPRGTSADAVFAVPVRVTVR